VNVETAPPSPCHMCSYWCSMVSIGHVAVSRVSSCAALHGMKCVQPQAICMQRTRMQLSVESVESTKCFGLQTNSGSRTAGYALQMDSRHSLRSTVLSSSSSSSRMAPREAPAVAAAGTVGRALPAAGGAAADAAAGTAVTVRGAAAVAAVRQTAAVVQEQRPPALAQQASHVPLCSWCPGLGPEAQRVRVAAVRAAVAAAEPGVAAPEPRRAVTRLARQRTGRRRAQAKVAARPNLRRRLPQLHRLLRPRQCERHLVVHLLFRGGLAAAVSSPHMADLTDRPYVGQALMVAALAMGKSVQPSPASMMLQSSLMAALPAWRGFATKGARSTRCCFFHAPEPLLSLRAATSYATSHTKRGSAASS